MVGEEEEEETAASSVGSRVISPENVPRVEAEDEGVAGGDLLANIQYTPLSLYVQHIMYCSVKSV